MALTPLDIETAAPGKLHDGEGLYLDKRSASSASWLYKFVWKGKADEVGLGALKKIPAPKARELRVWCEGELAAGRNPRESRSATKAAAVREREEELAERRSAVGLHELVKANLGKIAKRARTANVQQAWLYMMSPANIGALATMQAKDITRDDVIAVMEPMFSEKPRMAQVTLMRLALVLRWAHVNDMIRTPGWTNPAEWRGNLEHKMEVKAHTSKPHRALDPHDVPQFIANLRAVGGMKALALEWVVISATRSTEARQARWDEINERDNCWVVPVERLKVKNVGEAAAPDHRVPLTTRHHEILAAARALGTGGEKIFGSVENRWRNTGTAIAAKTVLDLAKELGGDITVHGMRASFATWAEGQTTEIDLGGLKQEIQIYKDELIEGCLAHVVGSKARRAYRRSDQLELRRHVMAAWAAYCGSACEPAAVDKLAA